MSLAAFARRHRVAALLAASAACFALAWAIRSLETKGPSSGADRAAALGGLRTVTVGGLFLRAEALKKEGRFDELPALYREILDLDPTCESAVDHLADTLSRELRASAATPEGRVRWWIEAATAVDEALARTPHSVRLLWRRADLLLVVADDDPDSPEGDAAVAKHLKDSGRDREKEAFESLREAARLAGDVPRIGRIHLVLLARHLPRVAAERLARGDDPAWFLSTGADVLRWRDAELAEVMLGVAPPYASAAEVLQSGLALVAAARDALRGTPSAPPSRERARDVLDHYVAQFGDDRVAQALRPAVR